MDKTKLTASVLATFSKTASVGNKLWDSELKGFHVLRLKDGASFRLFYRNIEGKQRTITLARYPGVTADQARKLSQDALGRVAKGEDVQKTKSDIRHEAIHRELQTLQPYLVGPYGAYQKRKKSGDHTIKILRNHFDCWFDKPMDAITPRDVTKWQAQKEAEGLKFDTIKRTYGALKTCLNHAVKTATIDSHQLDKNQLEKPHLTEEELNKSGTARRYLTKQEIFELFAGIEAYQHHRRQQRANSLAHGKKHLRGLSDATFADHVAPWILTMFYIGFRPGDLFGLQWQQVNLPFKTITKTIEKTAHHQPESRTFPLSNHAVDVLKAWHKQRGEPTTGYVFPSERKKGARMDRMSMQKPWRKIKELSGLPADLELYALRHNFASQLILGGADLLTVSKLMAHQDISTTVTHYGHLRPDLAREYIDKFAVEFTPSGAIPAEAAAEKMDAR